MPRFLKSAIAVVAAASMPLIAIAPASASSPDLSTFTFDCNTDYYNDWKLPFYGDSVTLEFQNCSVTLNDFDDTGNASTTAGLLEDNTPRAVDTVTITGQVVVTLVDEGFAPVASVEFVAPYEMPDPDGVQIADDSHVISGTPEETTYGTAAEIDSGDEIAIGDINGCEISPGAHIYGTQSFSVATAGDYTFRVTGVDPVSSYLNVLNPTGTELDDPMVALYSSFDSAHPDNDIVGCNDDLNDQTFGGHDYADNDFNLTNQGDYVEGHMSYFETTLEPGTYTLVFTTWSRISADDWNTVSPEGATLYFDVWGPDNGLELIDDPVAKSGGSLAATGVDPTFALWSGMFLLGAGAVILAARRRRERI